MICYRGNGHIFQRERRAGGPCVILFEDGRWSGSLVNHAMSPHFDAGPAWQRLEDEREWQVCVNRKDVLGSGRIQFDGWFGTLEPDKRLPARGSESRRF